VAAACPEPIPLKNTREIGGHADTANHTRNRTRKVGIAVLHYLNNSDFRYEMLSVAPR
jgi:hypothetical protein